MKFLSKATDGGNCAFPDSFLNKNKQQKRVTFWKSQEDFKFYFGDFSLNEVDFYTWNLDILLPEMQQTI